MALPALLAFLANPAFWKGIATLGSAYLGTKAGGGGQATAAGPISSNAQQISSNKSATPLMGFPSMAPEKTNYGEIIKKMLEKQKALF